MFRKIFIALAFMLPAMAFAQKFGTVDMEAIFDQMPEKASAEEQFANVSKTYETELANLNEQYEKEIKAYQELDENSPLKASRQQAIQDVQARIERFYQTAQQDMERQRQLLMQPIQEKILNAIKLVGAEKGFTFIFPSGIAFYQGADAVDCTAMVKEALKLPAAPAK
ncbi:MAG: OmpH family outer membrane protein [Muribaculaceae bacterium]|nr:OmpH family outer membrane protein [Muribaculaceae bacterium]MDE6315050.1 OmpH family outer membrane protein [Muribaculaceae bacterium]